MRPYAILCAIAALMHFGGAGTARADGTSAAPTAVPSFTFGARSGLFYASDNQLSATWYRPMMLEFDVHLRLADRPWLDRLTLYGMLNLEAATFKYHQDPENIGGQFAGIHSADMRVGPYLTAGAGLRLSLLDMRRWHLNLFGEFVSMFEPGAIQTNTMVIDVSGLQIDVAKPIQDHTAPTFMWRTYTYGATVSRDFTVRDKYLFKPYLTFGGISYRSEIVFKIDPALSDVLTRFKINPAVLKPRIDDQTKPFGVLGLRVDFNSHWALDVSGMLGRFGDTWLFSGQAGVLCDF